VKRRRDGQSGKQAALALGLLTLLAAVEKVRQKGLHVARVLDVHVGASELRDLL
jgi:hypothetical protein